MVRKRKKNIKYCKKILKIIRQIKINKYKTYKHLMKAIQ